MSLPASLRAWFVAHSIIDVVVAIPLMICPTFVLGHLGWTAIDPVATRLVAAALLAIGLQSFFGRNDGIESYRAMLRLKVIWSLAAVAGVFVAIAEGAPPAAWAVLAIFVVFLGVWSHHAIRLKQFGSAPDDEPPQEPDPN
ncbi:MAG TPA: hypothetical protein VMU50_13885 [Polyangia bacterium]|nr:hypothetical protein [Polyangia bacterium]